MLPGALSARLDWSSLELEPSSFVDEQLRGRQADLLFKIGCQGRAAFLYVLFEHQSTSDALMAFRLLRYMVGIWDAFLLAHPASERLPAILPVVLHHSDSGWKHATEFDALLDVDDETLSLMAVYTPQFRFLLDDLSRADDHVLRGRSLTAEGEAKGKAELLIRLLSLRFGALPDAMLTEILQAVPERLDVWAERVITGQSLEEILG